MFAVKFLALSAFVHFSSAATGPCTVNAITAAQTAFNKYTGFNSSVSWLNPVGLALSVQSKYISGSGTTGLVSVCNGYNAFLKSLSDAGISYQSCLDPGFIIANEASPATGYGYAGIMNMIGYQCGAGLYPALTKWPCIKNTYTTRTSNLITCLTNLILDAQSNTTAACSYTKAAINCWQNEFIQTCSNDNEVTYYSCQSIRSYTAAAYGECDDRCIIYQTASFAIDNHAEKLQALDAAAARAPAVDKILLEKLRPNYIIN